MNIIGKAFSSLRGMMVTKIYNLTCKRDKKKQQIPKVSEEPRLNTTKYQYEIVCWGDSMTAGVGASKAIIKREDDCLDVGGMSYPEILEQLTGIKTYNYGVSGATSEEIVVMQREKPAESCDVLILEIGSNGGWSGDYDILIKQYNAMIAHAEAERYIIVGDTDDLINSADKTVVRRAKQSARDKSYSKKATSWENALQEAFGKHFINMRIFLIENGLDIAGLETTRRDRQQQEKGNISKQLRADWTHFNSYGYYAKAVGIYQKGMKLGYW